jgi:CRP-like cAMP-binding protein
MTDAQFLFHTANVLFLFAYAVRGILPLRLLAIAANVCALVYYLVQPQVSKIHVMWGSVYISINVLHVALLLYERRPVRLNEEELALYRMVFRSLTPGEFQKLLKLARWHTGQSGEVMARKGEFLNGIAIIVSGSADVLDEGRKKAQLGAGNFVGEMSFVKGDAATADVVITGPTRYVSWARKDLLTFLGKHASLREAWQFAIGLDLVDKLHQRQVAS